MSDIWGIAIPGLAMAASELPSVPGLLRLDNPETGDGPPWEAVAYKLEDVAEMHAKHISTLGKTDLVIMGMSMGGMIVSIMASRFRSILPANTSFRVLVSSPNLSSNQAITAAMLAEWKTAQLGNVGDFKRILGPFFSEQFRLVSDNKAQDYYSYRALGGNKQSPKALYRQIGAIFSYNGQNYWPNIDPTEMTVIGGADDYILGPTHNLDLKELLPGANHHEISGLGHMVNLEMPELFQKELSV
ncbi:MAG: alpha/beta hydrolase [Proteobacteria bacterium]|nr:alpha/beta hydrolase [Pseudomonadota bacterium]